MRLLFDTKKGLMRQTVEDANNLCWKKQNCLYFLGSH